MHLAVYLVRFLQSSLIEQKQISPSGSFELEKTIQFYNNLFTKYVITITKIIEFESLGFHLFHRRSYLSTHPFVLSTHLWSMQT